VVSTIEGIYTEKGLLRKIPRLAELSTKT